MDGHGATFQTVFLTVFSGVAVYVLGQLAVKLIIEPVNDTKKTIATISHALINFAKVIHNPGVPLRDKIDEASGTLRNLSAQLHSHLFLVPRYQIVARVFGLPSRNNMLIASKNLIGLSNSLHTATDRIYEQNAKRYERVCDSLKIYMEPDDRWT
jgi:hypothetical protein